MKALGAGKTVGTLAWVFHVEASGVLSAPTDQLLHYPVPSDGISDFGPHVRLFFPLLTVVSLFVLLIPHS